MPSWPGRRLGGAAAAAAHTVTALRLAGPGSDSNPRPVILVQVDWDSDHDRNIRVILARSKLRGQKPLYPIAPVESILSDGKHRGA